jgi:hypothetical protein
LSESTPTEKPRKRSASSFSQTIALLRETDPSTFKPVNLDAGSAQKAGAPAEKESDLFSRMHFDRRSNPAYEEHHEFQTNPAKRRGSPHQDHVQFEW